ncbi:MAG: FHA domain-containing protein [Alphaproteobacteria bacterium]|nr:MAG: FHA domain-containing protein [Alphaproteobacteria bacterium]
MRDDPPGEAAAPQAESQRVNSLVVGWLVVVSGPGAAAYRGIFDGRNRIGRTPQADIPLDFGDPGISKEQAIIHYDPKDRKFLFIPQLDVENFSYVNQEKPTAPVELKALDEIEMAATTLRFVPLCGPKFDWSDLGKT